MTRPIILICILMSAMAALSMDIFLPSIPSIQREFAVEERKLQLSISIFLWGFAIAQLLAGLLSDRFGRRPSFLAGSSLYVLASLGCAMAWSYSGFLSSRLLQGIGACVGPVTALAIARDLLPEKERARVLSFVASAMALAPIIAPLIGSVLEIYFSWRANFYFLAVFVALILGASRLLPETLPEKQSIRWRPVLKAYLQILKNPSWQLNSALAACSFTAMFLWISASSIYLIDRLGFSEIQFAGFFGISAFFFMVGAFTNSKLVKTVNFESLLGIGTLCTLTAGSLMLALSWTELSVWRLWGPAILLSSGIGFVLPNTNAAAMGPFPHHAGKAAALTNFTRLVIAGFGVWIASHFYDSLGRGISLGIFGFGLLQFGLWRLVVRRLRTRKPTLVDSLR